MLATLIIVFREIIEAGLIVGIALAAVRGVARRGLWVGGGILAGVAGSCLVALFASQISAAMQGMGQEIFNASILSVAVFMLAWHNIWMARHGREMALHMKSVCEAVATGKRSLMALSVVVGVAVLREGSEIVLFLYGIAVSDADSAFSMALGGALGLGLGVAVAALMYLGLLKIHAKHLFRVTGVLIALLAAGMAAQATAFLQQAEVISVLTRTAWDTSRILTNDSLLGKVLHTLVGYTARPSEMQLLVYAATLAVIFVLMRLFGHAPTPAPRKPALS